MFNKYINLVVVESKSRQSKVSSFEIPVNKYIRKPGTQTTHKSDESFNDYEASLVAEFNSDDVMPLALTDVSDNNIQINDVSQHCTFERIPVSPDLQPEGSVVPPEDTDM